MRDENKGYQNFSFFATRLKTFQSKVAPEDGVVVIETSVRPNSDSAEFSVLVVFQSKLMWYYNLPGPRIYPLTQAVWSFNCFV